MKTLISLVPKDPTDDYFLYMPIHLLDLKTGRISNQPLFILQYKTLESLINSSQEICNTNYKEYIQIACDNIDLKIKNELDNLKKKDPDTFADCTVNIVKHSHWYWYIFKKIMKEIIQRLQKSQETKDDLCAMIDIVVDRAMNQFYKLIKNMN